MDVGVMSYQKPCCGRRKRISDKTTHSDALMFFPEGYARHAPLLKGYASYTIGKGVAIMLKMIYDHTQTDVTTC